MMAKHALLGLVFSMTLTVCTYAQSEAKELRKNTTEPSTMIILYSAKQFLVLQSTGAEITWTAETGESEAQIEKLTNDGIEMAGRVQAQVDLGKVFAQIAMMKREVPRGTRHEIVTRDEIPDRFGDPVLLPPRVIPACVFTLVLLDSNGVKTYADLTPEQCKKLRHSLAEVFDEVLEKSPFSFKQYLIRELLAPEDEVKATSRPMPMDRK